MLFRGIQGKFVLFCFWETKDLGCYFNIQRNRNLECNPKLSGSLISNDVFIYSVFKMYSSPGVSLLGFRILVLQLADLEMNSVLGPELIKVFADLLFTDCIGVG